MTQINPTAVVGAAVYLEFTKPHMTTQVLLLPEGTSSTGRIVPMTLYRRRLSTAAPRKTWKMASSPLTAAVVRTRLAGAPLADVAGQLLSFTDPLIGSLVKNGWTLYKDPIVIEVTAEDLDLAREAKTPYKALGRVVKARKALGFPKDIVHQVAAPLTPSAPTV